MNIVKPTDNFKFSSFILESLLEILLPYHYNFRVSNNDPVENVASIYCQIGTHSFFCAESETCQFVLCSQQRGIAVPDHQTHHVCGLLTPRFMASAFVYLSAFISLFVYLKFLMKNLLCNKSLKCYKTPFRGRGILLQWIYTPVSLEFVTTLTASFH